MRGRLFFDGASKGNPGPSGYGFVLELEDGRRIEGKGFLGKTTNNVAEYSGLIEGLKRALSEGVSHIEVLADSQLVVKQLSGEYRVRAPHLKELHQRAMALLQRFKSFRIFFVGREANREADRLANEAVREGSGGRAAAGAQPEESPGPTGQGAG